MIGFEMIDNDFVISFKCFKDFLYNCPSKRYASKMKVLIIEVVPSIASLNVENRHRRGAGRRAPRHTKTKPSAR